MTQHSHRPRRARAERATSDPHDRYGGHDPDGSLAHRIVTPPLLAGLTGVDLATCRTFHGALFRLIEAVGERGGVIAAPPIFVGPDPAALRAAEAWATSHPEPSVEEIWDDRGPGLRAAQAAADRIDAELTRHAHGLAGSTASDPDLTFASFHAFASRLIDDVFRLDRKHQCEAIAALADHSLAILGAVADVVRCVGGSVVHLGGATPGHGPFGPAEPP